MIVMGRIVKAVGGGLLNVVKGLFSKPDVPDVQKQVLQAPTSPIEEDREDEVNLGSDRSKDKRRRSVGKRQLLAPDQESRGSSTGLQI